ncbi:MAG TPA: AAA family ATPase [Treponemataceae bacterium]|nr:AAA family ATPase [Treponemataceae bacterium]
MRTKDCENVYQAAQVWKLKMLSLSGSILGSNDCWNTETISDLRLKFEGNLLEDHGRNFLQKLQEQLQTASKETKQLAAEVIWLLYLFPSNIGCTKKVEKISKVWNWSGEILDKTNTLLGNDVLDGIGSGGPGFNNHFWREFLCAIVLSDELTKLDLPSRTKLFGDGDAFASWIDTLDVMKGRQFRHMILHLLFPISFERISSRAMKKEILEGCKHSYTENTDDERLEIDRALRDLRQKLSEETGRNDFEFWDEDIKSRWKPEAGKEAQPRDSILQSSTQVLEDIANGISFYLVGASWDSGDKVNEFIDSGIWLNGYSEKYLDTVRNVAPGDKIAIKAAFRRKKDLPFDNRGKDIGIMRIKARGTVTENPGDGRRLVVEWEEDFTSFDIFGYVWQPTISKLNTEKYPFVVDWVFNDIPQPVHDMPKLWWGNTSQPDMKAETEDTESTGENDYQHTPINRIYYGPPGTGKTYKLIQDRGIERMPLYLQHDRTEGKRCLEIVTFHQSYSYEDFIEGLRPVVLNKQVSYDVRNGVFKDLCLRAQDNPDMHYAIFIDEINRGNVSAIFGESITLIEADKRCRFTENGELDMSVPGTTVRLGVSGEDFGIPINVDIYATMNTADRSLVRIDTALRRRFDFFECMPDPTLLHDVIVSGIDLEKLLYTINERIAKILDRDHTIGHAYFMKGTELTMEDLAHIFEHAILPLLEEYFFDDWSKIEEVLGDSTKSLEDRFVIRNSETESRYNPVTYSVNQNAFFRPAAYTGIYESI